MVTIKKLKPEDATTVAGLIKQLTPNIVAKNKLADRLADLANGQNFQYFVAELNGRIVGFAGLAWYEIPSKGLISWVEEVVVDQNARGQGVGQALMDKLLKLAQDKGCVQVKLTVANPVAQKLYEKLGFAVKDSLYMYKKLP